MSKNKEAPLSILNGKVKMKNNSENNRRGLSDYRSEYMSKIRMAFKTVQVRLIFPHNLLDEEI